MQNRQQTNTSTRLTSSSLSLRVIGQRAAWGTVDTLEASARMLGLCDQRWSLQKVLREIDWCLWILLAFFGPVLWNLVILQICVGLPPTTLHWEESHQEKSLRTVLARQWKTQSLEGKFGCPHPHVCIKHQHHVLLLSRSCMQSVLGMLVGFDIP